MLNTHGIIIALQLLSGGPNLVDHVPVRPLMLKSVSAAQMTQMVQKEHVK